MQERRSFHGLASYYRKVALYLVDSDGLRGLDKGDSATLVGPQWLAIAGRFKVLVIRMPGLAIRRDRQGVIFNNPQLLTGGKLVAKLLDKSDLSALAPELEQITYAHLWKPLAWLSRSAEATLVFIQAHGIANWGLAIAAFALLLKLVLLPVGFVTVRLQRKGNQVQALLAPQLAEIKAKYDGEEAHNRMMAAYKEANVSPFYTLKPMLGSLVQIPILIAIFNALGEMPQLSGQSFLWIDDLAYPDSIGSLPFFIPWIGDDINLLPCIMTGVAVLSAFLYKNHLASVSELQRQKRNVFLMALLFFFYFIRFRRRWFFFGRS